MYVIYFFPRRRRPLEVDTDNYFVFVFCAAGRRVLKFAINSKALPVQRGRPTLTMNYRPNVNRRKSLAGIAVNSFRFSLFSACISFLRDPTFYPPRSHPFLPTHRVRSTAGGLEDKM